MSDTCRVSDTYLAKLHVKNTLVETKDHCTINSYSHFPAPCLFDVQAAAKNFQAEGVDEKVYSLHAGSIYIDIPVFVFNCLYYQNSVSGGLVISSYFYVTKINGYVK